jgi:predicted RNA-binding protein with PIN domain
MGNGDDDGQLVHALGLAKRDLPKGGLERARKDLLNWLVEQRPGQEVLVIFDAVHSVRPSSEDGVYKDIRVRFVPGKLADDVIEELIAAEPVPGRLTIVSNDHRLLQAATRRGCRAWTCADYIDVLMDARADRSQPSAGSTLDKPERPSPEETDRWLREFGDGA